MFAQQQFLIHVFCVTVAVLSATTQIMTSSASPWTGLLERAFGGTTPQQQTPVAAPLEKSSSDWSILLPSLNFDNSLIASEDDDEEENETLRQFLLDAPRMNISVDHVRWRGTASELFTQVFCHLLPHRTCALVAAEFCTQTVLAPYFCAVQEKLEQLEEGVHFVDGGRQQIFVDSLKSSLSIEKPFKVVDFDGDLEARILFFVTLKITVDLLTGVALHRFFQNQDEDWVVLEENSTSAVEEEEPMLLVGGPQDIAARVVKLRSKRE